jgi:hypothetical protein
LLQPVFDPESLEKFKLSQRFSEQYLQKKGRKKINDFSQRNMM